MKSPLIVIVGETASGKSALALSLAQELNGEIIAADSRTVYKGMDIGTAKPSTEEMALVPHHLIDVVEPNEHFTAANFKQRAEAAITDITSRGKLPIVVGGTGLYINALLYDYSFRAPADPHFRNELANKSVPEMQQMIKERNITMPENSSNPRHLQRALESSGQLPMRRDLRQNTLVIGLRTDRHELKRRITERVESMIAGGLALEVQKLIELYGADAEALKTPGYKAFVDYLGGSISLQEARDKFVKNDLNLAKRQRTWFKRNKSIQWLDTPVNLAEVVDLITASLDKLQ